MTAPLLKKIAFLLIFCLFSLYQSWSAIITKPDYNADQKSIYLLTMRQMEPDFLARDYAYGDPNFLRFYTPVYLKLLQFLLENLKNYDSAIIFLHSLTLPLYLVTMISLLYIVSRNLWIALLVALLSALYRPTIASEVWGVIGLNLVFPRTLFLGLVPLLFGLIFRWLEKPGWWWIPLLGFLAGLSANLHPPSGLFFLQILITLVLAFTAFSLKTVLQLCLVGLAAVVGAIPTFAPMVLNIAQPTQRASAISFEKYSTIIHERSVSIFPFSTRDVTLPTGPLTEEQQVTLALLGLCLGLLWLAVALYWRAKGSGKYRYGLMGGLLLLVLPFAYLVTIFSTLDLIAITAAYWLIRLRRRDEDRLDLYALGILACAALYSFIGSAVLGWLWQTFEVWPLISFYSEQARMSRFVYLPLYIFAARWLVLLYHQRSQPLGAVIAAGAGAGLMVRHWHFLDPWGIPEWGLAASLVGVTLISLTAGFETANWPSGLKSVVFGLAMMAALYLWLYILTGPSWVFIAIAGGIVGGWLYHGQILTLKQWYGIAAVGVSVALIWLFAQGRVLLDNQNPLRVQAYKALGLYQYAPPDQEDLEQRDMFSWIKNNTPETALFYYDDRSLDLRFQAHRAATHGWKDLSAGYYSPPILIEYYERFNRLETAYQSPESLLACAVTYHADYIITQADLPGVSLPVVYQNNQYKIYSFDNSSDNKNSTCP
ncbi:MAG: hypothetical protein HC875_39535 [Anaerolineales bacterium]|nr:hypothetical protein [Anaerolineales bacterium]